MLARWRKSHATHGSARSRRASSAGAACSSSSGRRSSRSSSTTTCEARHAGRRDAVIVRASVARNSLEPRRVVRRTSAISPGCARLEHGGTRDGTGRARRCDRRRPRISQLARAQAGPAFARGQSMLRKLRRSDASGSGADGATRHVARTVTGVGVGVGGSPDACRRLRSRRRWPTRRTTTEPRSWRGRRWRPPGPRRRQGRRWSRRARADRSLPSLRTGPR